MTSKERVQAVLNRQPVDRFPVDLWHTLEVTTMLKRHFGVADDFAVWKSLGLDKIVWDFIDYRPDEGHAAGAQVGAGAEDKGAVRTAWGVPLRAVQAGAAHYDEVAEPPMRSFEEIVQVNEYPFWPDPDRFDYEGAVALAQRAAEEYCVIGPWVSFFEIYCQLRGLEQAMMDLVVAPDFVDATLDRIEAIQTQMLHRFFKQAHKWIDLVFISDDIGGQNGLMLSPASWRRHLQPRLKRWCDLAHDYGVRTFYHSDGGFAPVLDELLRCGVDVLNPIQHRCPGMEMESLKREYGDRVIFHGGIDNQLVLPFGTPEEVRAETEWCMRTLGAGGEGYICCSCHNVQAGTPVENILAMVQTVQNS